MALDRKTGTYVAAKDLDALIEAVLKKQPPQKRQNFHIFRIGYRAALELRARR